MMSLRPKHRSERADGLFRLLSVAARKFSADPATREHSARMVLMSAIALYAEQTSPADAALISAEALAELARNKRLGDR